MNVYAQGYGTSLMIKYHLSINNGNCIQMKIPSVLSNCICQSLVCFSVTNGHQIYVCFILFSYLDISIFDILHLKFHKYILCVKQSTPLE